MSLVVTMAMIVVELVSNERSRLGKAIWVVSPQKEASWRWKTAVAVVVVKLMIQMLLLVVVAGRSGGWR